MILAVYVDVQVGALEQTEARAVFAAAAVNGCVVVPFLRADCQGRGLMVPTTFLMPGGRCSHRSSPSKA